MTRNNKRSFHPLKNLPLLLVLGGCTAAVIWGIRVWTGRGSDPPAPTAESERRTQSPLPIDPGPDGKTPPARPVESESAGSPEPVSERVTDGPNFPTPGSTTAESLAAFRRQMQERAPLEGGGDAEAHLWLAKDLLRKGIPSAEAGANSAENSGLNRDDIENVQRHLLHATRLQPDFTEAIALRAGIYETAGQRDKAIEILEGAVEHNSSLLLILSSIYRKAGDEKSARRHAMEASRRYREMAESDKGGIDARLAWANAELFLGNHDVAIRILSEGLAKEPDQRYKALLATVCFSQTRHALSIDPPDVPAALEGLGEGVAAAPTDFRLLNELSKLSNHPQAHDRVREIFEGLIASDRANGTVYLALGSQASNDGDLARAIPLLEKSLELDPKSPAARNNLAVCLIQLDPPQLERSLALVEKAIRDSTTPGATPNPAFLETRGRIFIAMESWTDAIADLERCLTFMPDEIQKQVHAKLALAYRKMGNEALAAEHDRFAIE